MLVTTKKAEEILAGPQRARATFEDEDGVTLREPLDGLLALGRVGKGLALWEHRPEVPPGVDGGCVFHLLDVSVVTEQSTSTEIVLWGTWTGVSRRLEISQDRATGKIRHVAGTPRENALVRVLVTGPLGHA